MIYAYENTYGLAKEEPNLISVIILYQRSLSSFMGVLAAFMAVGLTSPDGYSYMDTQNKNFDDRLEDGRKIPQRLFREEMRRLLDVADYVWKFIINFIFRPGLRLNEARGVRVYDINLQEKTIFIPHGKGDKPRYVAFDSTLKSMIVDFIRRFNLQPSDYILCVKQFRGPRIPRDYKKTSKPYSKVAIYLHIRKLASVAQIQSFDHFSNPQNHKKKWKVHTHTLRHTFASMLLEKTHDLKLVQEALGHRDIRSTLKYLHMVPSYIQRGVEGSFQDIDDHPIVRSVGSSLSRIRRKASDSKGVTLPGNVVQTREVEM